MRVLFDKDVIPERVLKSLRERGPSDLKQLYGACGAQDGGDQYFVRRGLAELRLDCKIRLRADRYELIVPVTRAVETEASASTMRALLPTVEIASPRASAPVSVSAAADVVRKQVRRGAFRAWAITYVQPGKTYPSAELAKEAVQAGASTTLNGAKQSLQKLVSERVLARVGRGKIGRVSVGDDSIVTSRTEASELAGRMSRETLERELAEMEAALRERIAEGRAYREELVELLEKGPKLLVEIDRVLKDAQVRLALVDDARLKLMNPSCGVRPSV